MMTRPNLRQERSEEHEARAHLGRRLERHEQPLDVARGDLVDVRLRVVDDDAEVAQRVGHDPHVLDLRDVREAAALAGQGRGGEQLQRSVLRPADRNGALESMAALDPEHFPGDRLGVVFPVERTGVSHGPSTAAPRPFAVSTLRDPDPQQGLLEMRPSRRQVDGIRRSSPLERPLRLTPSFLRLLEIDVAGQVGRLGHHHDPIRPNLQEPAHDRERLLLPHPSGSATPRPRASKRGGMVRQDPQLPLDTRKVHGIHRVRIRETFRRHDLKQQRHQATSKRGTSVSGGGLVAEARAR